MGRPEAAVEALLFGLVNRAGGMCVKLLPTVTGTPDRLVLLPGGRHYLVELKAPAGRLSEAQRYVHRYVVPKGHVVVVLSSRAEVRRWVEGVLDEKA